MCVCLRESGERAPVTAGGAGGIHHHRLKPSAPRRGGEGPALQEAGLVFGRKPERTAAVPGVAS